VPDPALAVGVHAGGGDAVEEPAERLVAPGALLGRRGSIETSVPVGCPVPRALRQGTVAVSLAAWWFLFRDRRLRRWEAAVLLVAWPAAVALLGR
jgi:hypothetical protein